MQRSGNSRSFERLSFSEFITNCHQTGHFGFGDGNFFFAPVGKFQIGNDKIISHNKKIAPKKLKNENENERRCLIKKLRA